MRSLERGLYLRLNLLIIIVGLAVAILQGNSATAVVGSTQRGVLLPAIYGLFIICIAIIYFLKKSDNLGTEGALLFTVFLGMLLRTGYVLMYDIYTLQNDVGTFTGFGTSQVNTGHIGYAEYIYKFMKLPDMDPYELFPYFHPPVHYIIEALWLTLQRIIGVPEALAFENLQIPTLIYSGLCIVVMVHILDEMGIGEKGLVVGSIIMALHPKLIVFAGSVNNDALSLLMLLVTIWRVLVWINDKTYLNIILAALSLGIGMVVKLNTMITAFSIAVIFLVNLVSVIRHGNRVELRDTFLQYIVFAFVSIPIGLSFVVRNIVVFDKLPGIPTMTPDSSMYTGGASLWERFGIPSLSALHLEFPFHGVNASWASNTWVIMFQTRMFSESFPASIEPGVLAIAQIAYGASIAAGVILAIAFVIGCLSRILVDLREKEECIGNLFLLLTFLFIMGSYALFVFKYPYTCSSDYRYITSELAFLTIGFVWIMRKRDSIIGKILQGLAGVSVSVMLIGAMIFMLFCDFSAM